MTTPEVGKKPNAAPPAHTPLTTNTTAHLPLIPLKGQPSVAPSRPPLKNEEKHLISNIEWEKKSDISIE